MNKIEKCKIWQSNVLFLMKIHNIYCHQINGAWPIFFSNFLLANLAQNLILSREKIIRIFILLQYLKLL